LDRRKQTLSTSFFVGDGNGRLGEAQIQPVGTSSAYDLFLRRMKEHFIPSCKGLAMQPLKPHAACLLHEGFS
jgi:hypothetical protein